ncbi:membrane protein insertase YidC [Clostridium sp. 19966]|uniref:membrane protein insertase YidC n=1 Tax=Clostridium sp. 19966 TaxID=2768166 RepID=UPI0028DE3C5F|nr:membrane protein insertase YidC [Clostridium sp. 19966]MDT8719513.1 membrane protein insertase YidC [Clostridium sp. 19966]
MQYITNFLTTLFEYVHSFVKIFISDRGYSYGFTIILFTAIIKTILLPVFIKQTKSTAKMQEIQPKMKEIQTKYKNDPQKAQMEMSKLYKESGANPFGGCLPLILIWPVFAAMYAIIRHLDLNGLSFTFIIPDLGKAHNVTLAVLSAIISYVSMSITMNNMEETQAKTMKTTNIFMTVFTGYITYTVQSGLGVYWVANGFFQLLQNLFMKKMGYIGGAKKTVEAETATDKLQGKKLNPNNKNNKKRK